MIDGIRPRKRTGHHLRPVDRHLVSKMVVGRHPDADKAAHRPGPQGPHPLLRRASQSPDGQPPKPESDFRPPDTVEAAEEQSPETSTNSVLYKHEAEKRRSFKQWLKSRSKKWWIIFSIIAVLVLSGAAVGAWFLFFQEPPKAAPAVAKKEAPKEPPKPVTVASNLTGLQVDPAINERPVTGIMIENSPDARPQSGLEHAGVVFEAIAEGGITRFLTLYQDNEPDYIGPVRSVRPYYIQWAMGFDAPLAHVGGSPEALSSMKSWKAKDLDQFAGSAFFTRISSRYAPHNVYTSIAKLRQYENQKGYGKSTYTGFARKAEKPAAAPTASSIDFNISSTFYNAHFDYDAASNSYKRSEGGAPHMTTTANGSQTQLSPKVVVALIMQQGLQGKYTTYNTIGSGHIYVFQDGTVQEGTWRKDTMNSSFTFTDAAGAPLPLNPGQTWLTALGANDRVTYK